jgi:NADPH:quinone reductase-like Zn-dependent oxidoreductase
MIRGVWYAQGPPEFGLVVSWQPVTRGVVLDHRRRSFFDILGGPQTVTIRSFAYWDSPVPYGRDLAVLVRLVATGRLYPEIGRLAGWEDAATTLTDLYERRIRGKAVLTIP